MNKLYALLSTIFILFSCSSIKYAHLGSERNKIQDCKKFWTYEDLETEIEITVLKYDANLSQVSVSIPNFIIGETKNKEIIAFMDKDYLPTVSIGSKISMSPCDWDESQKNLRPLLTTSENEEINHLHCAVKKVYYACIKP